MTDKKIMKLEQRPRFKGRFTFEIKGDGTVDVNYAGPAFRQQLTLSLAGIDPNPAYQQHKAIDMIVGMCIFAIPVLGFLVASIKAQPGTNEFPWFFGMFLVFLLPFGLCWYGFIKKSFDIAIFTESSTGKSLIIHKNLPDPDTFTSFVSALQEAINKKHGNIKGENNIGFKT
ncbi:MAG: hypothetical protein PHC68_13085 [Syntrophorhabdaceae bacterium]|jgi:hypothetical protein|nr:hypothetical protein [Syntrophorhabdaceae bacterium]